MNAKGLIAVDLGAGSGKMCYASFNGCDLTIEEYKTFPNQEMNLNGNLYWDVFSLYRSILDGVAYFKKKYGQCTSLAIDAWGASYGLLDRYGRLMEPVFHYRDRRTDTIMERVYHKCSAKRLFELTGCQCNRTYTLPQLVAQMEQTNTIESAQDMLLLPDLLAYFMTGNISSELTIAGTSGLQTLNQKSWSALVADKFSIPTALYTEMISPGTLKGRLLPSVQQETGTNTLQVFAAVSHDSASAVCAIPGFGRNKLYISIGTNVSMGVETDTPIDSEKAFKLGVKNTAGFGDTVIVYRDFSAMWHLNQVLASFHYRGEIHSIEESIQLAADTQERDVVFDLEDPWLNTPCEDYCARLNRYFQQKGIPQLKTYAGFIRAVLASIADKIGYYAKGFQMLGFSLEEVLVVSGGAQNKLLLQLIKEKMECPVCAGLPYGSLAGNLLTQLYALGEVANLDEMREISGELFPMCYI